MRMLYYRVNDELNNEVELREMMETAKDRKDKVLPVIDSDADIYAAEAEYTNSDHALAGVDVFLEKAEGLAKVETAAEASSDDNGNLQLALGRETGTNALEANSAYSKGPTSGLSPRDIKTQISLLGGRPYSGHWFDGPEGKWWNEVLHQSHIYIHPRCRWPDHPVARLIGTRCIPCMG